MKNVVILLLILSFLFCSACIVAFENPLSDSQSGEIDKRLSGKWKSMDKTEVLFEFSSNSNSETILKLFEEEKSEKIIFSVSSVKLGKYQYLSMKLIDEDNDDKNTFLIARYEIVGDEMTVWLHDKEKIKKLIDDGKLKGSPKNYGEISISNSSKELENFLESTESDQLYVFFGKFKKQ